MRTTRRRISWAAALVLLLGASPRAHADSQIELSGSTGFGVFVAGVGSGRFAVSPSGSLSVRGERGFFAARDTVSLLGVTGGRFGINNEATRRRRDDPDRQCGRRKLRRLRLPAAERSA